MTENLQKKVESEEKGGKSFQDDRFYYPERDSNGSAYAVIRFLPEPEGEDMPYVYYWHHGFKGPGGWYIENSRTTLGDDDPITEMNSVLWDSGVDDYKNTARERKRRLTYVSNIIVLHDPKHPENEGKVFLFRYGKRIHDMIKNSLRPEFEDENPVNPFDFWDGANFKLKIRKVDGQTNYDKSEFEDSSALFDGDEDKLEEVYQYLYSLKQFVQPENFKDYNTLKQRRDKVIGPHDPFWKLSGENPPGTSANSESAAAERVAKESESASVPDEPETSVNVSSTDDDLEDFKKLADDDDDEVPFGDL